MNSQTMTMNIPNYGNQYSNTLAPTATASDQMIQLPSYTLQPTQTNLIRKRPHSDMSGGGGSQQPNGSNNNNNMMQQQLLRPNKPLSASITLPLSSRVEDPSMRTIKTVTSSQSMGSSPTSSTAAMPGAALEVSSASSTSSSGSNESVIIPTTTWITDNKKMISSPQEFFTVMLQGRGYPAKTFCSLKCGYHNIPTKHQTTSYGVSLTKAIRSSDAPTARALLRSGLHPNACNKFGESIVHAACRRGDSPMLVALLEAGSSVQITDDFGRTPLHDACWTSTPNFDTIRLLLDRDPWLLCIVDCRGSTPLGYVRKAHWAVWIGFLGAIADRYWPEVDGIRDELSSGERHDAPPLAFEEPNSRPVPDPERAIKLEIIELLANGKLSPEDLQERLDSDAAKAAQEKTRASTPLPPNTSNGMLGIPMPLSRITLDPLRRSGSNATTMMKGGSQKKNSSAENTLLQGFVEVSSTSQQVFDCT